MASPSWTKTLSEVLFRETERKEFLSKSGDPYETDYIPKLLVQSTGIVEEVPSGGFRYSVIDRDHGLEYQVKAPNKISVDLGTKVCFFVVRGGTYTSGRDLKSWFSAEKVVSMVKKVD